MLRTASTSLGTATASHRPFAVIRLVIFLAVALLASCGAAIGVRPAHASPADQGIWCVQPGPVAVGAPCTSTTSFEHVQDAISIASPGDEIRVVVGTFQDSGSAVVTVNKDVTIRGGYAGGTSGWSVPSQPPNATQIDGQSVRPAFVVQTSGAKLENLETINGGIDASGGTANIQDGFSVFLGSGNSTGAFSIQNGSQLSVVNIARFTGSSSITGPGILRVNGGTAIISGTTTVDNLEVDNQSTVSISGSMTVNQTFNWTGGGIVGPGPLNVSSLFNITGGVGLDGNAVLNNNGTATWTGSGSIQFSNSSQFNNNGTFNINTANTNTFLQAGSGTGYAFNNYGTVTKSTSTGITQANVPFNNISPGTVSVQSGTLNFNGGGTATSGFSASQGANVSFTGNTYNLNPGSGLSGAGFSHVLGATVNISGTIEAQNLELGSGVNSSINTPTGSSLGVTQVFSWTGGTLVGRGGFFIGGFGQANIGGNVTLQNALFYTSGPVNWTTGDISFSNGSTFIISDLGNFNINTGSANTFLQNGGGTGNGFYNEGGVVTKSGGTGITQANIAFNNEAGGSTTGPGLVRVESGTLNLAAGGRASSIGQFSGTFDVSQGAQIAFTGATYSFDPGSTLTGAGFSRVVGATAHILGTVTAQNLEIASGTVNIHENATLSVTQVLNWSGGLVNGPDLAPGALDVTGSQLNISGGVSLSNVYLYNEGTANWTAGNMSFSNGAHFNNNGTFDINAGASTVQFVSGGGTGKEFDNYGSVMKMGTGIFQPNIMFNNFGPGGVGVGSGVLNLNGGGNSTSGYNISPGANLNFTGSSYNLNSGSALSGGGLVDINGATVDINATVQAQNLQIDTGGIVFSPNQSLNVGQMLNWNGGLISGNGDVDVESGADMYLGGAGGKTLSGSTINNDGTTYSTGTGAITMQSGAKWDNRSIFVDQVGHSILSGTGGGAFDNASSGTFTESAPNGQTTAWFVPVANEGNVTASSGTLSFGSSFTQSSGSFRLAGGVATGPIMLFGGTASGGGTTGPVTNNGATIMPGATGQFAPEGPGEHHATQAPLDTAGRITINGTYSQAVTGTLAINIGGTTPGTGYSQLGVTGSATLSGTLNLSLINGYTPNLGDTFQVMTYTSHTGTFSAINGLDLGGGHFFSVAYGPTSVNVSVIQSPALVGHVTWQGRGTQPDPRQQIPITLTLRLGSTELDYPALNTDASGYFTLPVGSLPSGTYNWRVKDPKYLANAGTVSLTGAPSTSVEMGLMKAGDANNDNAVSLPDFNILRSTFAKAQGDPSYDARADFNGDNVVNTQDFNLLRGNFGQGGAPPVGPVRAPVGLIAPCFPVAARREG